MKKFIYLIILITFVFISSANPFEDIPEAHWAYEAVNSLSDKEILTGLPEDIFDGSQKVTRYDFASMLSRVINRLEKTNGLKNLSSNDVNSLSNLFNEFQNELALIDVRYVYLKNEIESIKKDIDRKNPYPKINLTGESVLDYNNFLYNTLPEKSTYRGFRNFNYLNLHASPNSETGIYLTFFNDNTDWIGTAGADVPRNDLIKLGYIELNNIDFFGISNFDKAILGRQNYLLNTGLLFDSRMDGTVLYGKDFNIFLFEQGLNNTRSPFNVWGINYSANPFLSVFYSEIRPFGQTKYNPLGFFYDVYDSKNEVNYALEYIIHRYDSNVIASDGSPDDMFNAYRFKFAGRDWKFIYSVHENGKAGFFSKNSLKNDDFNIISPLYRNFPIFDGNTEDLFLKYSYGLYDSKLHFAYELIGQNEGNSKIDILTLGYEKEVYKGVDMNVSYSLISPEKGASSSQIDDISGIAPGTDVDSSIIKMQMRVKF